MRLHSKAAGKALVIPSPKVSTMVSAECLHLHKSAAMAQEHLHQRLPSAVFPVGERAFKARGPRRLLPPPPHRHVGNDSVGELHHMANDISRHGSNASYNHSALSRNGSNASYNHAGLLSRHGSHASYHYGRDDQRPDGYHTPRVPSPQPPSPADSHMTPSPLREAMDGVMEQLGQLGGLGMNDEIESPDEPLNPWSPECF